MRAQTKFKFPSSTPRPKGELEKLKKIWARPTGVFLLTAVNNTTVGLLYLGAAFLFFLLGGLLALLMRLQLSSAGNTLVSQDVYNQIFTVHGTTMMFLFAVPAMEALGVLLLPQMLAARDLPFPRLGAFAIWAYIIGGLVFFSTVFYGLAPKGGWFMYPPLTLTAYSPGNNADFWLLGIGFIEISAIAGAIEIIVGVLKTRPPGMTLDKMPIFAWAMLIFAAMIVFAFPAVILATMLLEIERSFGWPFFTAAKGGDPLLWQHLFWFFGHPEVYIIFLPAAGLVSMIVAANARTPLVGYHLIVVALVATGFFSFGLWVHHMYTTGIPALSLSFFSAASMAVAIPSGIQFFSWLATIAAGERFRINTPSLFVLGFLFIFALGGLTGVMVAVVPFDWQAHDTYFVVAHFHYVLVGGMVFPLFATFYFWTPMVSRNQLSERLGRWVFWLMFIGFNVAFFPMHIAGLRGMVRRVWTYPADLGLDLLNMISTIGAFTIAAGVLVFIVDVARNFRLGKGRENPWQAGTLEWLPSDVYTTRSIPHVVSREPLWDQANLARDVAKGRYYLPNAPTGGRETIVTSPVEATPQYIVQMPGPGWMHVIAAVFMAAFFLLLTVKAVVLALICGAVSIAACVAWVWELDPEPAKGAVSIGAGIKVPTYMSGPASHSWWAMIILILVAGSLYISFIFSYFYLWTVSPQAWAPRGSAGPPAIVWPAASGILLAFSALCAWIAAKWLPAQGTKSVIAPVSSCLAAAFLAAAIFLEIFSQWCAGLRPTDNAYAAMTFMGGVLNLQLVLAIIIMTAFTLARHLTGKVDKARRVSVDNTNLLIYYAIAQAFLGLVILHGFPRAGA